MLETTFTHKFNTTFLVNGFTSFPWACASCPPCNPCHKNPENLINTYSVSSVKSSLEFFSFLVFVSLLVIHILLHTRIMMLFLYLMAKAAFYGCLTERQREKGARSRTTMPGERFSGCFASLQEEQTIEPIPPTQTISQTNCLLCGLSGGNRSVFPVFGSFPLSHIRKHPKADSPCRNLYLNLALLSDTEYLKLNTSRITRYHIHDIYSNKRNLENACLVLVWKKKSENCWKYILN